MKKLALAALLATGTSLALFSCNNGAYDADPNTTGSPLNPLNPTESGVSVFLGRIRVNINNTTTLFYPAYYVANEANDAFSIIARKEDDEVLQHTLRLNIMNFKNTKEFSYNATYSFLDTSKHHPDSVIAYGVQPDGTFELTMNGNEDGNLRGHFSGNMSRFLPKANSADVIRFDEGEYYVPKRN